MNKTVPSSPSTILMALLGGATLGGFAVALSTSRTGMKLRKRILALVGRAHGQAGPPNETSDEPVQAVFI